MVSWIAPRVAIAKEWLVQSKYVDGSMTEVDIRGHG